MKQRWCAVLAVMFIALGLVACQATKPISVSGPASSQHRGEASPGRPGAVRIVVKSGDTVYTLAREYNVPVRSLIEANQLQAPYTLQVGQFLELPETRLHKVVRGDTLYGISRQYKTDITSLARANDLTTPYAIKVGQELRVPGASQASVDAPTTTLVAPLAPVATTSLPRPAGVPRPAPQASTEKPNDTSTPEQGATSIPLVQKSNSDRNDKGEGEKSPNIPPLAAIPPKQDPIKSAESTSDSTPEVAKQTTPHISESKGESPKSVTISPPEKSKVTEPPATLPAPPPRAGARFEWPVRGKVISVYGPKPGGLHNDGINIVVRKGTPVRAAENGIVVYAGNELKGYGNLLLVRHADGWLTAYAHNDSLRVARGDKVLKGQVIANTGATGNVNEPQLHFEVRRGSQAVDPLPLLAPSGV